MSKMLENGFITLDRKICKWRWFHDANTFVVFMYLILQANYEPHEFEGITIGRGQIATSYPSIAKNTGLSTQSVRTGIKHLILTGEVTVKKYPKYSVYTIVCYDKYQNKQQGNSQPTNRVLTGNQQSTNTNGKKAKNIKNTKNINAAHAAQNGVRTDNPGRTDF